MLQSEPEFSVKEVDCLRIWEVHPLLANCEWLIWGIDIPICSQTFVACIPLWGTDCKVKEDWPNLSLDLHLRSFDLVWFVLGNLALLETVVKKLEYTLLSLFSEQNTEGITQSSTFVIKQSLLSLSQESWIELQFNRSNCLTDGVASHHSVVLASVAFFVTSAAAAAVEVVGATLATFLPLVLERLLRFLVPPELLAPLACFLPPLVEGFGFVCCFLGAGFWAALVHAATAFVRAAVDSTHLSCSDGFAVGPTSVLNRSMSEKRPAVLTSDWRILNLASADWKRKRKPLF